MWTNRFNYLLLIGLIILAMMFYNHYAFYLLIIAMVVLPVISFVLAWNGRKKIKIYIETERTSVGKNIPVDVSFVVENRSFVSVENMTLNISVKNCFYENITDYKLIIPSVPFGKRKVSLSVSNLYCGRMIASISSAVMYDLLGLFKFKLNTDAVKEVMIMPYQQTELDNIPVAVKGQADDEEIQYEKGDDVSQISEIRSYIPGDKLQNIHWKLTAKAEELQVKEYSKPFSDEVTLVVETYIDKNTPWLFDEIIEKMFAISVFFIKQGRKYSLCWYDAQGEEIEIREVNNNDELISALVDFYFVHPGKVNGNSVELINCMRDEIKGTVLYLCDNNVNFSKGDNIDIGSERVVLSCLD